MSKRPGRKPQQSAFRKRQLSSDAKIIVALLKNQPQDKAQLLQSTGVSESAFYRDASFLLGTGIIKITDGTYSLWFFDPLEKIIEDTLIKFTSEKQFVNAIVISNEIGKPWPEIASLTYQVAKKLGLTISGSGSDTIFLKTQ